MISEVGAVIVAAEDEASTYEANVAGGSVSRKCDYFLISRGVVDVGRLSTRLDECSSTPRESLCR